VWALITLASGILVYSLLTGDFGSPTWPSTPTAACPSSTSSPRGGRAGRVAAVLELAALTYAAVVALTNRRKHRDMMPFVVAVLATVQTFFLILNNFVANPFQMLATDKLIVSVPDGSGLSPLLQYPAMAIHRRCCTWGTWDLRCRSRSPSGR